MFHHFLFIERLAGELRGILTGSVLHACFSQQKDELLLTFLLKSGRLFHIKASLTPKINLLSFPDEIHRKRKNSVDLFDPVLGDPVTEVGAFTFERSFYIRLAAGYLIFKMHGNRSNILLSEENQITHLFRSSLARDKELQITEMARSFDLETILLEQMKLLEKILTPKVCEYMSIQHGYAGTDDPRRGSIVKKTLDQLRKSPISIVHVPRPEITLLPVEDPAFRSQSAIEICNRFFYDHITIYLLQVEKEGHLKGLVRRKDQLKNQMKKLNENLERLRNRRSYEEIGHIIMANLHQIQIGSEIVTLHDLYTGKEISIKLKKDLTPQKNAEGYYRKAKNEAKEIQFAMLGITTKEEELAEIVNQIKQVDLAPDLRALHGITSADAVKKKNEIRLPYRKFDFRNYSILVGKDARSNDKLTFKHTQKNDTWLHARDVSGSHVVVKGAAQGLPPTPVLEYAASIAAYYSKRKSESLCPVIYTQKKYVRKPKGFAPGKVIVEREQVIMVPPRPPDHST